MLSTKTKATLGVKAAKQLAKHPGVLQLAPPATKAGWKLYKPLAKRRARKRVERIGETARGIAMTLATVAPAAARGLGIFEPPKQKRAVAPPALAAAGAGAVVGASAVYFLEPGQGRKHRAQVAKLVS